MLETDATNKLCPFKCGNSSHNLEAGDMNCSGRDCMGWQALAKRWDGKDWVTCKEPNGECEMVPPTEISIDQQF